MKYKWLNNKGNKKLIIFFNGWGMDECVVKHLEVEDYDVIMFYDYSTLDTDFIPQDYQEKYLVAWSMGVMIGTKFGFHVNSATAINGTLKPIDAEFGIHPKIYDLTIRGFDEKGREKFIQNMFNDTRMVCSIKGREDTIEELKSELSAIKTYSANFDFKYTKVLISDNDKIIPTKSQCAYWKMEPNLKSGHFPFSLFKKWSELL